MIDKETPLSKLLTETFVECNVLIVQKTVRMLEYPACLGCDQRPVSDISFQGEKSDENEHE